MNDYDSKMKTNLDSFTRGNTYDQPGHGVTVEQMLAGFKEKFMSLFNRTGKRDQDTQVQDAMPEQEIVQPVSNPEEKPLTQ